jgi:ATP-dependent DNA helicase RecG
MKELDGGFSIALFKDLFTPEQPIKLGLNDRQLKAVVFVKERGKITNSEYQELNDCSRNSASNDLGFLVQKNILVGSDIKGAGAFYQLK